MKLKAKIAILIATILPLLSFAQKTIELPYVETNSHVQSLLIKSIEISNDYTVVNIRYVNSLGAGWIRTYKPGDKKRITSLTNMEKELQN